MGVIYRELLLLLAAAVALAAADATTSTPTAAPTAAPTAPTATKDADDNSMYQYEDYDTADQEEVLFSEDKPCPRDCICSATQGYRIANCNRLELGTQKFGDDITDLVLENIDPRNPIRLDDAIFKRLGLHQIATVKIVNSTISSVSLNAFHGLHELYAVTLSNNGLSSLHPETFANNKKLLLLTLSENLLKFPAKGSQEYFLNASSVQELDISNCNMRYIASSTFGQLRGLMYLNVAGNDLSGMDTDAFRSLPDLEELDLSDNNIMDLAGDLFSGNTELATLHIQRNPINTVYGLEIPDIVTLNAGQTRIKFVGPSMFNGMTYISNLNLSGIGIEKIHNQAFHKLVDLNYLDLSYNDLDIMSTYLITQNIELDIFKISHNPRLKQLPRNGFNCSVDQFNIYLFDAASCGLEEISDNALRTFPALTQINLSGNKLQSIGDNVFAHCTRLIEVNLANNMLTSLSRKMFAQNKEMSKLNLRGNPLKVLSSELFIHTPKLTWLDISQAELSVLWEETSNHPATLLNNLLFLNISHNNIKEIKQTEIDSIENLTTLDISFNPLVCNREFELLMTWLSKHKVSSSVKDSLVANLGKEPTEEDDPYSWESLARTTCKAGLSSNITYKLTSTAAPASDEEIWEKIEKTESVSLKKDLPNIFEEAKEVDDAKGNDALEDDEAEDADDEDEDEDEDEDDDYDNDVDLKIKLIDDPKVYSPRKVNKVEKLNPSPVKEQALYEDDDDIDIKVNLLGRDEGYEPIVQADFADDGIAFARRYNYLWPILIVVLGAFLLLIVIGKVIMIVCSRRSRQSRYNSAIIAAMSSSQGRTKKDCGLVYQQLSEELTGPRTPKLARYAPLPQPAVETKPSNVSYESSPFHHTNIVPEAV